MIVVRKYLFLNMFCASLYSIVEGQATYYPVTVPYFFSAKPGGNFINALNAAANPSLIPDIKNIQAAVYAEKKYLTDINLLFITACASFGGNGVSLMVHRFGNPFFSENVLGLGYGKKIGAVNTGILFQNVWVKIPDAESVSLLRVGLFSSYEIDDNVYAGIRIVNPDVFAKVKSTRVRAASSFSISLGWQATGDVYAGFEYLKDEKQPLSLVFTLQYSFGGHFACAINWNTSNNQPFSSISWQQQHVIIEAGCSYHPTLGPSPTFVIIYKKEGK